MGASVKELIEKAERMLGGLRGKLWCNLNACPSAEIYDVGSGAGGPMHVATVHAGIETEVFIQYAPSLVEDLAAELRRLTELRPIAEAPRDGTPILGVCPGYGLRHLFWNDGWFLVGAPADTYEPTHFRPLEGPR